MKCGRAFQAKGTFAVLLSNNRYNVREKGNWGREILCLGKDLNPD
jgi:hypothetical protein